MNEPTCRNTPLYEQHCELGARMAPFANWNMPIQYSSGIIAEHTHTRKAVSLFDICHMGEFEVQGTNAATALDLIFARPVKDQPVGVCRYNFLLNTDGRVMDDLIVYRLADDKFFIVVNAGTRDTDAAQISSKLPDDIQFKDVSDTTAKLDLQGPLSADILQLLGLPIKQLPTYFHWGQVNIADVPVLLSRTGYTGELGFELYFNANKAAYMWKQLLKFSQVNPAGLGARDTLRLEMGYALYGHELSLEHTPLEAGYGMMLKLDRESQRDFIGKTALLRETRHLKLIGIRLDGRRAAREGAAVLSNGTIIGRVTSGAFGPSVGSAIAMAYVDVKSCPQPEDEVKLEAGRVILTGKVSSLPFYKNGSVRNKL